MVILASCGDDPVDETVDERTNSEATGDVMATTIGQETGGAGTIAQDASSLAEGFSFGNGSFKKSHVLAIVDSSYDPVTKLHTVTVERNRSFSDRSFTSRVLYEYTYYTGMVATPGFTKGVTDRIVLSADGHQEVTAPRISTDDSSRANFIIRGIAAGGAPPTMSGEYWRGGNHISTKALAGKHINVDQTITLTDCTLTRNGDSTLSLSGSGHATYKAIGPNGNETNRNVAITFNGDGTATLAMTRTNQGVTDSCVIDVKTGNWLKWVTTK